jgi:immune inhibitor A
VGYWGLMGYGAWGAGGNTPWSPSHMEAWSKVEAGFVTPTVITENTYDLRIPDVETHPACVKVWRLGHDTDTCFYLENRQQKGFDTPLPGPGLLIWHIDPAMGSYDDIVDLEEDSTFHLDDGPGVRPDPHVYHQELGDTSDALPGNWNRTTFDSTTVPSSKDRLNHSTGVCVRNVRQVGDTIICDVIVRPDLVGVESPATEALPRFTISPNPCRAGQDINLHTAGPASVAIYDAAGRKLGRFVAGTSSLTLPGLASGVYVLRVRNSDMTETARLTVRR